VANGQHIEAEVLADLLLMLRGDTTVVQSSGLDGLPFDPFSFQEDGLASSEVDARRGQVGDAFVVSQMIVVGDEVADLRVPAEYYVRQYSWCRPPRTASIRSPRFGERLRAPSTTRAALSSGMGAFGATGASGATASLMSTRA
jgi:hypothetical protein